jgi:hypothetical protein
MTLKGVESLLLDSLRLFNTFVEQVNELSSEEADRAIFEHDFMAALIGRLQSESSYRSDLDFGGF